MGSGRANRGSCRRRHIHRAVLFVLAIVCERVGNQDRALPLRADLALCVQRFRSDGCLDDLRISAAVKLGTAANVRDFEMTLCPSASPDILMKELGFQPECGEQRKFGGYCNWCWRIGHKEAQCWFKQEYMKSNPSQDQLQRDIREWSNMSRSQPAQGQKRR